VAKSSSQPSPLPYITKIGGRKLITTTTIIIISTTTCPLLEIIGFKVSTFHSLIRLKSFFFFKLNAKIIVQ
jgi:hypothetical protein